MGTEEQEPIPNTARTCLLHLWICLRIGHRYTSDNVPLLLSLFPSVGFLINVSHTNGIKLDAIDEQIVHHQEAVSQEIAPPPALDRNSRSSQTPGSRNKSSSTLSLLVRIGIVLHIPSMIQCISLGKGFREPWEDPLQGVLRMLMPNSRKIMLLPNWASDRRIGNSILQGSQASSCGGFRVSP